MSAFLDKKELTSEFPTITLGWNRPLRTASDISEYTSRYPVDHLNARIKSLAYLIHDTVCLFVSLMTERPDETEAWIRDRDCIDNESDSNKIFIRELIACYQIYQEDPEIGAFYKTYVLNNIDKLKAFAEDCQRLPVTTIVISEESLTSLEEEYLSRIWQVVKSNNTRLIQWSCCMLLWCRQAIPELIFDPIYEAESACKDMYATIHEVPRITAKLLYIITNINIYKCRDTYETVLDTTDIIEKFYQTHDSIPLNKLLELNSLRICSCKIANLHTSLYAEIRNIKYTIEEISSGIIVP